MKRIQEPSPQRKQKAIMTLYGYEKSLMVPNFVRKYSTRIQEKPKESNHLRDFQNDQKIRHQVINQ
jgi:hypothetical protein